MVCREISESVTGLNAKNQPFVYLYQPPGTASFSGFKERHDRREDGKMFATETAFEFWKRRNPDDVKDLFD